MDEATRRNRWTATVGSALLAAAAMAGPAHADDEPDDSDEASESSSECALDGAGALIVKSNADGGVVLINSKRKATLRNGTATVVLPRGRYRLSIEADGFRRRGAQVEIAAGEATAKSLTLRSLAVAPPNPWKTVFIASLAATGGSLAFGAYSFHRMRDEAARIREESWAFAHSSVSSVSSADCGREVGGFEDPHGHLASACGWHRATIATTLVTGGLVAFTAAAGYMAFVRDRREVRPPATRIATHARARQIAVVPTISADGAGASIHLGW